MTKTYFIGVDGGGTSCRARIRDEQGTFLGEGHSGSANLQLGIPLAYEAVMEATRIAAEYAGLNEQDYANMHAGWALAAAEQPKEYAQMVAHPHPFASVTLDTDAHGACFGAFKGEDGAILIAGTGSSALIIKGEQATFLGGRGFPLSDQGGGAVLGLRALQQTLLAFDGFTPPSSLASAIMSQFDNKPEDVVVWAETAIPKDYGSFSPLIFEHAIGNDPMAVSLLQENAADITMLLNGLVNKGAKKIALMGSVGKYIQPWLNPAIKQYLVEPQADAMDGAIIMAQRGLTQGA